MDGMRYEEDRFQMNSGDILVAYSDGITEPENDFGEFGEARLMEVVARYRDQPLAGHLQPGDARRWTPGSAPRSSPTTSPSCSRGRSALKISPRPLL